MSRCVIISAGPYRDPAALAGLLMPDDYVIAADGGWQLAAQMGVKPSVLVGDFDSMPVPAIPEGVKLITLPVKKDVTDTAKALEIGYESGYRDFLLLGCTGGRLDHLQASLVDAVAYVHKGCAVVMADETNEIYPLSPGHYLFRAQEEEKVSFFAFGGEVTGLFATEMVYDVSDMTLSPDCSLCVSNEAVEESFCVSFRTGTLLMYLSKD
ncbi:MAG: thiamine diphosphokinase [Ruminococcaceae bacterium]|nr:thiamine diphosphokinase [Oscillospiraceae bacterium]